jgi:hypothetical protein
MRQKNITQPTVQRLAFIKYLFNVAVEQSRQPEPLAAASILTFHDSIELFLCLSYEHLGVNKNNNTTFLGHWEMLKPKLSGEGLTQKAAMSRLDASRGNLKHKGLLPHKQDIEELRASAMNFFIDNTPLVFDVDFGNISMINLVTYEETRERLKKAEEHEKKGEIEQALIEIGFAFNQLINDYEKTKHSGFGHSPFFFGHDMSFESSSNMGLGQEYNPFKDFGFSNFVEKVTESLEAMRKAIEILSLGIDYRQYIRFQQLVPEIFKNAGRSYSYRFRREQKPSIEDYEFCFNFVIDSAIRLEELNFEIKS